MFQSMKNKKGKLVKKLTAYTTLIFYLLQPVLAAAADVVADPNAAKNKQPVVDKAPNGTTLVQIATPSAAGISHNLYQQFNVDPRGLILNNSRGIVQTQLGGYIAGNPNLAGGAARVIINEVSGTSPSYLRGFTEIAGNKADLIIANPNGIIGNNFGFINAGRATLTTGTPLFGGSGSLEAFRVTGGQIAIEGEGLNGNGADRVDLISQAVNVNAGIWTKELNVVTGSNEVNYTDLSTKKLSDSDTGVVALDVGQLGGMYANKIRLIGTDKGVGVNSQGNISAIGGDLVISQEGKIQLAGSTSATGNTSITANSISSTGTIGAGIKSDGSVGTTGDLTIQASQDISLQGQNLAGGNLMVQGAGVDLSGAKSFAGKNATLTAIVGDIKHTGATFQSNGILSMTAAGNINNDKNAGGIAGDITATKVNITGQEVNNLGGKIIAQQDSNISAKDLINTQGIIASGEAATISVQSNLNNQQGTVETGKHLDISANNLINQNGRITSLDNSGMVISSQNTDNTFGTIGGNGDIRLNGNSLNNQAGTIAAGGSLIVNMTDRLDNKEGKIAANKLDLSADSINNSGVNASIRAVQSASIIANSVLNNTDGALIYNIGSEGTLAINAGSINSNGTMISGTDANISAQTVTISGSIGAGVKSDGTVGSTGNLLITGKDITFNGARTVAGGDIQLTAIRDIDNTKSFLQANNVVTVIASGTLINDNAVLRGNKLSIQAGTLSNQQGLVEASKDLGIAAQSVNNQGGRITSLDTSGLTLTATQTVDNTAGTIGANGDVALIASAVVNNGGSILSKGTINVDAADKLENANGKIVADQDVNIGKKAAVSTINNTTQGSISAGQTLTVNASVNNIDGGKMLANRDINLAGANLIGAGSITAGQDINFELNGDLNFAAGASVTANRDMIFNVASLTNYGSLSAVQNLKITGNALTNGAGALLQGGSELNISIAGDVKNGGTMQSADVSISGQNISNTGAVFGTNLTMTADTISNTTNKAVIASTGNVNLFAKSLLENKDDATIYSAGNINIAGSKKQDTNGEYTDKTISILNQSATIEADGSIAIYADTLTNKMREYEIRQTVVSDLRYDQYGVEKTNWYGTELWSINRSIYSDSGYSHIRHIELLFTTSAKLIGSSVFSPNNNNPELWVIRKYVTDYTLVPKSPIGKIMSATNMKIRTNTINNDNSWVIANNNLDVTGTLNNNAIGNTRTSIREIVRANSYFHRFTCSEDTGEDGMSYNFSFAKSHDDGKWVIGSLYKETTTEQLSNGELSIFGGGKQVNINAVNVNNLTMTPGSVQTGTVGNMTSSESIGGNSGTNSINLTGKTVGSNNVSLDNIKTLLPSADGGNHIKQTVDSQITLPANAMYKINSEPNAHYLVETDSRFTSLGKFISSDTMLEKLGYDPAKTTKRLGDGFYEQKMVRDQVTELTGRYTMNGYSSAEEQYKALLNNGATYAKQFNLQIGVALTAEQMSQLTSDIVWLVEKEVNGQKVLVPQVYLANSNNYALKDTGALIVADNVNIQSSGDVNNAGNIVGSNSVQIAAANISNYGGTIDGGASTKLNAGQDLLNFSGVIQGKQIDLTAGRDFKNETVTFTSSLPFLTNTHTGKIAEINAGQNLNLQAGRDVSINGAKVNAGKDITITAQGALNVDSVKTQERLAVGNYLDDKVNNVVSSINGNNVSLSSKGDATLKGAQVTAENELKLTSSGNIDISAVKDESIHDETKTIRHGWKRTRTDDETVIGSNLTVGGKVTIETTAGSNGNITIAGSNISSDKSQVSLNADKDITVKEVTEKHESLVQTHTKKSGFLSSTTKDTFDHSLVNQVRGSTISGDSVSGSSGKDLTVQGSNVVGTNDVSLTATNNVNVVSAKETGNDEHYSYTKKSGLFSGGGLGFTIGSTSQKTTTTEKTLDEIGSTVGSTNGNVNITAGKQVNSVGTTMVADKNLNITGKDVTIDNSVSTYDSHTKSEYKQSGLTVSLGGGIVTAGMNTASDLKRSSQVSDDRLKALYDYKAVKDAQKMLDSKGNLKAGVGVSVSIGSSTQTSEQTTHTETANLSNITAGDNVKITATDGDINLKGTNIKATDVDLDAKQNINIEAAQNKEQVDTKTSSSSWSVGGTIGSGFSGNYSKGSGKENENSISNIGSSVTASDALALNSGSDTNIIGSQAKGDKVTANVGGNLNIASLQDIDNYTAKNQNAGFGLSGQFDKKSIGGVTGSISKGKTDSNYASVTNQAGIYAGKGGFDIQVGKNTDLKGAVIASDATPDKNKLSTGTLTYSDIQNKADYSASSVGVNVNTKSDAKVNEKGVTPNIGVPASGDASSTTKSAIANGTIEIRSNPKQDISGLSRDTSGSLNALGKIFDKAKVQEKQELSKLFGELAYEEVHKISDRAKQAAKDEYAKAKKNGATDDQLKVLQAKIDSWNEGGSNKIALHALVGGIMSDLGGSGFLSGAVGAGVNEAIQGELAKRFKNNPDMHQWASALVGSVASTIVGGNVQAGASVAASGTKNNWLYVSEQEEMAKILRWARLNHISPADAISYYYALSQSHSDNGGNSLNKWEAIEPNLLHELKYLTDNYNNGLNFALNDLSWNVYGGYSAYNYYRWNIDYNSDFKNPFAHIYLPNDGANYNVLPSQPAVQESVPQPQPRTIYPTDVSGTTYKKDGKYFETYINENGELDSKEVSSSDVEGIKRYYVPDSNSWCQSVDGKDSAILPVRVVGNQEWKVDPLTGEDMYNKTIVTTAEINQKYQSEDPMALDFAKFILKNKGIDPEDPNNASALVDEVERQHKDNVETREMVTGVVGGEVKVVQGAKGLIGKDFEEFLSKKLGGNGSFLKEGRDFDGGIGNRWWEAKSGQYWDMIMSDAKKLEKFKSDMGARLRIATENGATYELHSNTPIPQFVKEWLEKKGIKFTEW